MNRARKFCHKVDPSDSHQEQLNKVINATNNVNNEYEKITTIIMCRLEKEYYVSTDIIEYYNDLRWVRLNLLRDRNKMEEAE